MFGALPATSLVRDASRQLCSLTARENIMTNPSVESWDMNWPIELQINGGLLIVGTESVRNSHKKGAGAIKMAPAPFYTQSQKRGFKDCQY